MEVNNIEIKPLVLEIVEEAVKKDLFFAIDCLQGYTFADDYFYQHPTQDLSLLCNQKPEDQYVGTDNLDDCYIFFFNRKEAERLNRDVKNGEDEGDYDYAGWLHWTNWNDGTERVVDYTVNLDKLINLREVTDNWENKFEQLKKHL